MKILLNAKPSQHIYNVGNKETVTIREWVHLCYRVAGRQAEFINVRQDIEQRNYFCFYNYEYCLDVPSQNQLMPELKHLQEGLKESFSWYKNNSHKVNKKPYIEYLDKKGNSSAPQTPLRTLT